MSNYTQNVSYAPKDALLTGDPNKAILGSQIDAEFSEISTAIASKEDSANKGQPSGYAPLNGSSLLADSYLTTNIPRLDAIATISAVWTFSAGPIFTDASSAATNGWSVNINNSNPGILLYDSDAAADEKVWEIRISSGDFILSMWSDAFGGQITPLTIARTGAAVGAWTFSGTSYVFNTGAAQFTSVELGHATDTTLSRVSAGVLAVEGATLATISQAQTISAAWNFTTAPQVASLELGNASDTTLTRVSAGLVAVEGVTLVRQGDSLELGHASDTSLTRVAAGRVAVEGVELGYRQLPGGSVTTGAFGAADQGKGIYATAGVTIPNSTMAANDVVIIQNTTGSSITITKTITTAYNTSTGSALGATFTLGARGRCAIIFTSATECYVTGDIS